MQPRKWLPLNSELITREGVHGLKGHSASERHNLDGAVDSMKMLGSLTVACTKVVDTIILTLNPKLPEV